MIISPFRGGVSSGAVLQHMRTAERTYLDKLHKYDEYTFKSNVTFQPFAIEEFGTIHPEVEHFSEP